MTEFFTSTVAPSCFALLSEKIRERQLALSHLKATLPHAVSRGEICSTEAVKIIKSFLDWLNYEIRTFRKSSSTVNSFEKMHISIKELKWVISLMDSRFSRIDLSDIVLEVIDRLNDVMVCTKNQSFPEISQILGNYILSKSKYLRILSESKLTSRFHRLLVNVSKIVLEGEASDFIKILACLAISIPNPLKIESFIYEHVHEALLHWFSVSNIRPDSVLLPAVLGALNSLMLDGYYHSTMFHAKYYPFVLKNLKTSKNPVLVHKIFQFLLFKEPENFHHRDQLKEILLAELLNPTTSCSIYDCDPAQFCTQAIEFHNCNYIKLTYPEQTRFMFLKLCNLYITEEPIHVPFILFKGLKNHFKNVSSVVIDNIPQIKHKNIINWLAILKFHINSALVNFDHGGINVSWYKIFYICKHPDLFVNFPISALDEFISSTFEKQITFFEPLVFNAIYTYFQLRFHTLSWTKSAENCFKSLLDAILFNISESQDLIYRIFNSEECMISFIKCLFFLITDNQVVSKSPDCLKSYDCALVLSQQDRLSQFLSFNLSPPSQDQFSNSNDYTYSFSKLSSQFRLLLGTFFQNLINSITESEQTKIPKNSMIYFFNFLNSMTQLDSNEICIFSETFMSLHSEEMRFVSLHISKYIPLFAPIIAKNIEITRILSEIVPILQSFSNDQNEQQHSSQRVVENSSSFFEDDFSKTADSNNTLHISLITPEVFRDNSSSFPEFYDKSKSSIFPLIFSISETLLFAFENNLTTEKTENDHQILQDWNIFMRDIGETTISNPVNPNNQFTWTLHSLAQFLHQSQPFFKIPSSLRALKMFLRSHYFDHISIIPDSSIVKLLFTPEQWITIFLVLFEAPQTLTSHIVNWFLKLPAELFGNEFLLSYLKCNLNQTILYDFLFQWISSSRLIADFPFEIVKRCKLYTLTENCIADFIFTSPHLPLILSQFNSFDSLSQFCGNISSNQVASIYFSFLLASLLLTDSRDTQLLLKSAIDPHMNTLTKLSFVDIVVTVLSHGQSYQWNRVVAGLQQLARLYKLSAATDFSEIFNPLHSIQIIRELIPKLKNLTFLTTFITQVPIISHHPQLIRIILISLKLRIKSKPVDFEVDDLITFFKFVQNHLDPATFKLEMFNFAILFKDDHTLYVDKISSLLPDVSIFKIFNATDNSLSINGIAEFDTLLSSLSLKYLELIVPRLTDTDDQNVLASILSRFDHCLLSPSSLNLLFSTDCTTDPKDHFSFSPTHELISTILSFAHHQIFVEYSLDSTCCEVIFRLLNVTHLNGNRKYSLDSLTQLSSTIKEDLRMFVLPLGSKILCFNKITTTNSTPLNVDNDSFSKPINSETDADELLKNIIYILLHTYDQSLSFIAEIFTSNTIFHHILPFLLKSPSCQPHIPKFTKLLINLHENSSNTGLIKNILHLIIELAEVGPNFVDSILRQFNNNQTILQELSTTHPKSAIYLFSLLQESNRLPSELNLSMMNQIYKSLGAEASDYLEVVKQRLRKFDTSLPEVWDVKIERIEASTIEGSATTTDLCNQYWLQRKWFDECDFHFNSNKSLTINQFIGQSKKLQWFHNAIENSNAMPSSNYTISTDKNEWSSIELIKTCSSDLFSSNCILSLTKLISNEPNRLNYQTVTLLPLISPKYDQMSKFILADMTAKVLWNQKKHDLALETAKAALHIFPDKLADEGRAMLLLQIGEWAALSKSDRPSHILSQYLDKAMALCESVSKSRFSSKSLAQIHLKVARFVDEQYQQIKESDDFKSRSKLLEESRESLAAARLNKPSTSTTTTSDRRQIEISVSTLRSQYDLDMQEYSERLRSLNSFLLKAIQNYISALNHSTNLTENEQMAAIFRLCALWFCHADFSAVNDLINTVIGSGNGNSNKSRDGPPLHLFLPLIYQLAARASYDRTTANPSHFQRTLMRLLVQLTVNHHFDCIYQLIALRSGSSDSNMAVNSKKRKLLDSKEASALDPINSEADLRSAAAGIIIDQARKIPSLSSNISAVEILSDAYVELASHPPPSNVKSTATRIDFDKSLKISKLLYPLPSDSALKHLPIPTSTCKEDKFAGFMDGFKLMSGINLPKQIDVVTSSGSRHSQLVKGNDDVRQDAVMEQVFLRVNRLLQADCETRRRKLAMRTYRVIPLRPLVGLLEWVSDSTPLATYLTDAHERLRPADISPSKCRELLRTEAERAGSTVQSKLNVLLRDVGSRFRPVLRFFFFEHFSLAHWWEAKQAYTRSMATASIVGWIVGLGDRHGMNILLDKKTGEVVHIDLNMIFEAGRTLRVPERVPFRLTPDCIDGMGPEGIGLDGPFKRHAISTLAVLRREQALLLMILDVFKYDPLQKWTGIAKALKHSTPATTVDNTVGSASTDLVSKEAHRALLRIKEKLEGREEGTVLSEAGHVTYLIQTSTDPELLCQMYFGWQAYF